jgi:hypothetical protein
MMRLLQKTTTTCVGITSALALLVPLLTQSAAAQQRGRGNFEIPFDYQRLRAPYRDFDQGSDVISGRYLFLRGNMFSTGGSASDYGENQFVRREMDRLIRESTYKQLRELTEKLGKAYREREKQEKSQRRAYAGALPKGVCPGSVIGQMAKKIVGDLHVAGAEIRECGGGNGSGGDAKSDVRLKRDIVLLTHLDNGLGLYRYRYLWSDQHYVGVMAQEVAEVVPDAVLRGDDGYLRVDYRRLGLRLMTWEEWAAARGQQAIPIELAGTRPPTAARAIANAPHLERN